MEVNKISLPVAYMIEIVRSHGVSDEEFLVRIESGDVSPWREFHAEFDFNELVALSEKDPAQFRSIILDGYEVKYVSIYGLKNLLKFKLDKLEERDYHLTEKGITDLKVDDQQLAIIRQFLPANWTIQEIAFENRDHSDKKIKIEL